MRAAAEEIFEKLNIRAFGSTQTRFLQPVSPARDPAATRDKHAGPEAAR